MTRADTQGMQHALSSSLDFGNVYNSSLKKDKEINRAWWGMSIIPAPKKYRQEDCKLEASLGYILRSCVKKKKKACLPSK
jgi:hypothetical protein